MKKKLTQKESAKIVGAGWTVQPVVRPGYVGVQATRTSSQSKLSHQYMMGEDGVCMFKLFYYDEPDEKILFLKKETLTFSKFFAFLTIWLLVVSVFMYVYVI